jgi:hypothetical protein
MGIRNMSTNKTGLIIRKLQDMLGEINSQIEKNMEVSIVLGVCPNGWFIFSLFHGKS